jgi:hypothetical protein
MISHFRRRLFEWLLTCRLFEWVTTFIMLGMAATIIASPSSLEKGAFRWMLVVGFTPVVLGMFVGIVGAIRCVALYANGRSCLWGPRLRALGALGGAFIWVWMGLALVYLTNDTGTLSLGIFNWFGLALGEMVSCARAGSDVRAKPVY